MKRLGRYFIRGLVVAAPLAVTIYVFVLMFRTIDGWLHLPIPGVGFVATLALVTLIGFLASSFLTRRLIAHFERLMERLPLARLLYTSTRDFLNAFVGEHRRFDQPVLVALHESGEPQALGFVTQPSLEAIGLPGHVAVYFPQSYHFAGMLVVVPADRVAPVGADSAAVMAFIVSGGVTALTRRSDLSSDDP
jgi:uncharacterized membrane protein